MYLAFNARQRTVQNAESGIAKSIPMSGPKTVAQKKAYDIFALGQIPGQVTDPGGIDQIGNLCSPVNAYWQNTIRGRKMRRTSIKRTYREHR